MAASCGNTLSQGSVGPGLWEGLGAGPVRGLVILAVSEDSHRVMGRHEAQHSPGEGTPRPPQFTGRPGRRLGSELHQGCTRGVGRRGLQSPPGDPALNWPLTGPGQLAAGRFVFLLISTRRHLTFLEA